MRYLDTGNRNPDDALGHWLGIVLAEDVRELRWQTGYFALEGIGLLLATLERLRVSEGLLHVVVGSNDGATLADDVSALMAKSGIPRVNAQLGVVSYGRGLYHPKTYHVTRSDGTVAAYVGSANLTSPGVSGLNV